MSNILDTIVVTFGEDVSDEDKANFSSYTILDDLLNKDINGETKTSFSPGDDVNIICQLKPGWRISKIKQTSGQVDLNGLVSRSYTQEKMFFVDTETDYNLSFYPSGNPSGSFYGNSCSFSLGEDKIVVPSSAPVIVDVSYSYRGYSLTIHTPKMTLAEGESWPLGVVIQVVKT